MTNATTALAPLRPTTLAGRHVRLEPLEIAHAQALTDAVKNGDPWKLWYTDVPSPDGMMAEIERRLALQRANWMLPFSVRDLASGDLVGMTTYMNIELAHRRLEIGSTWLAARVQRTPVNTESKLLLLAHAFDELGCIAVEWRTHVMNLQSRRAIERLGAKLDGVLRSHRIMRNGTLRDTAVYSVVASEWPAVRANLSWQLDKPRP